MSTKELDRVGVINRLLHKEIVAREAAVQLGLSVRHIKRLKKRVKTKGVQGIIHQGRGRASNRTVKQTVRDVIITLLKTKYVGFGPTFASEKLREAHTITISNESLRTLMMKHNLWNFELRNPSNHSFAHP